MVVGELAHERDVIVIGGGPGAIMPQSALHSWDEMLH